MAWPSDLVRTKNWGSEVLTDADLEGQLDLIINWVMAALDASTGHDHDGTANNGPEVPPVGTIILWDGANCPSGYTRVAALDGAMLKFGSAYAAPAASGATELPVHSHTQNSHNHTQDSHVHNISTRTADSGAEGVWIADSIVASTPGKIVAATATNQAATATNQNAGSGTFTVLLACKKD